MLKREKVLDACDILGNAYYDIFRSSVRKRRLELEMTQKELAHRCGLKSKVSITRLENGYASLSIERMCLLAKVLNTTPNELLGGNAIWK